MAEYILILLVLFFGLTSVYLLYERYTRRARAGESSRYIEALRDLLDGKQEAAFTKLRQVVTDDSNNIDAYLRLGQILRDHSRPEKALDVHKDLTLRGGLTRECKIAILRQLSMDYMALNEIPTAESALKELLSLDSQNRWAYRNLLNIQEKALKWDDAYDTATHLLKLESNKSKKPLARFKYYAGLQLYRKREYHKARVVMKEAIGLDPTYVQAYLTIGDSYYDEKRFEDAVNFWGKLISVVPEQGHQVIDRLKKTLFELGRYGDIVEICQDILKHDPKNLGARRAMAEFYEKKGEVDAATEILEEITEDYPDDYASLMELIRYYLEKGDRKKLDELLRSLEKKQDTRKRLPLDKSVDSAPVGSQS